MWPSSPLPDLAVPDGNTFSSTLHNSWNGVVREQLVSSNGGWNAHSKDPSTWPSQVQIIPLPCLKPARKIAGLKDGIITAMPHQVSMDVCW